MNEAAGMLAHGDDPMRCVGAVVGVDPGGATDFGGYLTLTVEVVT